jgi:hypothetical protein
LPGGTSGTINSTIRGINYWILPANNTLFNETSYSFEFNLTSSFWDVSEYGFNLRLANGTIISGGSTGTVGTPLTLNYNVVNESIIYMDYYWVIDGEYTNATRSWVIMNSAYTDWSIKTFFTDLNSYMDEGFFGIDDFAKKLIVFLIMFTSIGILSYKFGLTGPLVVTTSTFFIIFFFDIVVNIIPPIRGIENLLTFISGLVLIIVIFREVQR